jgi:hypothetical protein
MGQCDVDVQMKILDYLRDLMMIMVDRNEFDRIHANPREFVKFVKKL